MYVNGGITTLNQNKHKQLTHSSNLKAPSFQGDWKGVVLDKAAEWGPNPQFTVGISSVATAIFRPLITMIKIPFIDKNTTDEERQYSAAWQGGVALGGLGTQLALMKPIDKISIKLSEVMAGDTIKNISKDLKLEEKAVKENFLDNDRIAKSILEVPEFLNKIVKSSVKALKPNEKMLSNNMDEALSHYLGNMYNSEAKNAVLGFVDDGISQSIRPIKELLDNPELVKELRTNKNLVQENPLLQKISEKFPGFMKTLVKSKDKVSKKLTNRVAKEGAENLKDAVSVYLSDMSKGASRADVLKQVANEVRSPIEVLLDNPKLVQQVRDNSSTISKLTQKSEIKHINKLFAIKGAKYATNLVLTLVALTGATAAITKGMDPALNYLSMKFRGKPFSKPEGAGEHGGHGANKAEGNKKKMNPVVKKAMLALGGIGAAVGGLAALKNKQKIGQFFTNIAQNKTKYLGEINHHSHEGVELSVGTNLLMRCVLLAQQGQMYALLRAVVDEVLALGLLKSVDKACKKAQKPIAKMLSSQGRSIGKEHEGVRAISEQAIKNVAVIGIGVGFLNNVISGSIMTGLDYLKKLRGTDNDKVNSLKDLVKEANLKHRAPLPSISINPNNDIRTYQTVIENNKNINVQNPFKNFEKQEALI